jgi:DNA polymerase III psi subunit
MICEIFKRLWEKQGWHLRHMGYEQWNELAIFSLQGATSMQLANSITITTLHKKNPKQTSQHDQYDYIIIKKNQ